MEVFHQQLLAYLKEHYNFEVKAEFRYSDQCAQQFKSQVNLIYIPALQLATQWSRICSNLERNNL